MIALALLVLGIALVGVGARCAGSAGGYAVDRTGTLGTFQPEVRGKAGGWAGCLAGEALQVVGYALVLLGFLMLV